MKTKIILSIITVLTLVGLTVFFNSASESTSKIQVIDYFKGDPVGVFELAADDPSKGITQSKLAASKIGLTFTNAQAKTTARSVSFLDDKGKDATRHFEYDADKGYLSFNKGVSQQILSTTSKLPDAKSAENIANKFLSDNFLLPANKSELKVEHVGGIKRMSSKDQKEYDVMKTVYYSRTIDGVPVVGEGSRVIVEIGNNGEVMAVTKKWKEVKPSTRTRNKIAASELKSQAEAEAEFKQIVASQFGSGASSKIQTISKTYFDGGDDFIQPIYLMASSVRFKSDDGQVIERDYVQPVSMLKKAPEGLMGSLSDLQKAKGESEIKTLTDQQKDNPPASNAPKRQK
jgi:hypothetical protein